MSTGLIPSAEIGTMLRSSPLFVAFAFALSAGHASAQLESGPKVGTSVPGFKVHAVTGDEAGQVVDFVAARKGKPTVFAFVRAGDWDRPMARFLKKLDDDLVGGLEGVDDPVTVAVWLSEDGEKSKDYLPLAQESLRFQRTRLTVFDGDSEGPAAWDLNAGARMIAVVVRDGKVAGSFGYNSLNESDVAAVVKSLKPR